MIDEILNFGLERSDSSIIKVIGVGGGGCNAVKNMYEEGIEGVNFMVCNTDAQAMQNNPVPVRSQLGVTLTGGRGAGNLPGQGEQAAIENLDDIRRMLEGTTKMLFITAGMGGGTGTGAAPVIARLARELAIEGIEKLRTQVDSLLVISNEKLHKIYGNLPASQAFKKADNIITTAVKGVAEIITLHGNINIDFADVSTVMARSEVFIMGTGLAEGEGRAMNAVIQALESPLLDSSNIKGTKDILLNIISGTEEITMSEIGEIIDYLQEAAGQEATIIWGNGLDPKLGDQISVTIIATGFDINPNRLFQDIPEVLEFQLEASKFEINLDDDLFGGIEASVPVKEPVKHIPTHSVKPKRKSKKDRAEFAGEPNAETANVDSWFVRQFSRFFDEKDTPVSEENDKL